MCATRLRLQVPLIHVRDVTCLPRREVKKCQPTDYISIPVQVAPVVDKENAGLPSHLRHRRVHGGRGKDDW